MRGRIGFIIVVVAVLAVATGAHASHWVGIKVTPQTVDSPTLTADISVTGYTVEACCGGAPSYVIGGDTNYPAVNWGDGSKLTTATLAYDASWAGGYVLKGAFSHTYPTAGNFIITANTNDHGETCCIVTGNVANASPTGEGSDILSNTATVTFVAVPSTPKAGLWLLTGALALGGAALLASRRA